MNYFIEGLQGSGKSTLVNRLSQLHPECRAIREGDYSPVELSWCACMDKAQYSEMLERYPDLRPAIEEKSFFEDDRVVVCYTRVKTDNRAFYADLERYEIYNGRVPKEDFQRVILNRYGKWRGDNTIFECSLFQNIVEDMTLFQRASDEEIMGFYREIARSLSGRDFHILYLQSDDIAGNIAAIRRERTDRQGNEAWFSLMLKFFDESPYAASNGVSGESALLEHFRHRQALELRLCREVFPGRYTVLKSKDYGDLTL